MLTRRPGQQRLPTPSGVDPGSRSSEPRSGCDHSRISTHRTLCLAYMTPRPPFTPRSPIHPIRSIGNACTVSTRLHRPGALSSTQYHLHHLEQTDTHHYTNIDPTVWSALEDHSYSTLALNWDLLGLATPHPQQTTQPQPCYQNRHSTRGTGRGKRTFSC